MADNDPIIEAYRAADAEKRLYLFMDRPSLRDTFMAIDLGEYRAATAARQRGKPAAKRSRPARWLAAAANCCLK